MTTMTARRRLCLARRGLINARRARMPPSPWLSARMIRIAYLMEMTTISDQKISDSEHRIGRHGSGGACDLCGDAERIERARADVAENNAHARERCRRPGVCRWRVRCGANICGNSHRTGPLLANEALPERGWKKNAKRFGRVIRCP